MTESGSVGELRPTNPVTSCTYERFVSLDLSC